MTPALEVVDPLRRRAIPVNDPSADFFWASGADGLLRITRCTDCRYFIHPPCTPCPRCLSKLVEPQPTSGRGVLHTFTVNVQPWVPDQEPYVIAIVELVEQQGLRLTTNLVGVDVQEARIGLRVRVAFVHRHDIWYPVFRPDVAQ